MCEEIKGDAAATGSPTAELPASARAQACAGHTGNPAVSLSPCDMLGTGLCT